VAPSQFVNVGTELRLLSDKAQRYVITGRASGRVTEVTVEAGKPYVVSATAESLRVDTHDAQAVAKGPEGGIEFKLTQV
jgi:hypothetical protein